MTVLNKLTKSTQIPTKTGIRPLTHKSEVECTETQLSDSKLHSKYII